MNKLLSIITLIIFAFPSFAQDEETAKQILDDFSSRLNSFSSVKADFTFTDINLREQTNDSYEGNVTFKGDKFRLNVLETETWFNGKTLWNFLPDVNEVNVSEPDQEDDVILYNPFKLFTSPEARFKYGFRGELSEGGEPVYEIDLIPLDLEQEYSRIRIRILKLSMDLLSVKYFRKDGNNYLIEMSNLSTNIDLPDSHFSFRVSEHPGVEVIDLR